MGKKVLDDVLDAALDEIINNCDLMTVCSAEPADFAAANVGGGDFLADVAMSGADFTGPANGTISGRKIDIGQKTGVNVDNSGTATHVCLLDTVGSRLLYVTTMSAQVLTAGNTITINGWSIEIADPA